GRPADDVPRAPDDDAHALFAQGRVAGDIDADVVALDRVGRRDQFHAGARVAGEDVAGAGRGAADGVARCPVLDEDSVVAVAQRGGAALVGADQVAGDDVPAG